MATLTTRIYQSHTCEQTFEIQNNHTEAVDCRTCGERDSAMPVPFTSGYDRPHMLSIYVRAHHLEHASGTENVSEVIDNCMEEWKPGPDEADTLRYLAAAIEVRLAEIDHDARTEGA